MKKYRFLSLGFEKPTPEIMRAWEEWLGSVADRMVDQGGLWGGGREITEKGTGEMPLGMDSITGYIVFSAENLDEATKIAEACPIVSSNRVYEIMTR